MIRFTGMLPMPSGPNLRRRGISATELVVTITLMALLVTVSVVAIAKVRRGKAQAVCAANLHAIGLAFVQYAGDFQDFFPPVTPATQWEDLLRPYVQRQTFKCPGDNELFTVLGSSYDWRDTGSPYSTLAGKTHMQLSRNDVNLAFDILPGWHSPGTIQVLGVDQSIRLITQEDFFRELQRSPDKP